jgi:hypothetical protein
MMSQTLEDVTRCPLASRTRVFDLGLACRKREASYEVLLHKVKRRSILD